MTTDTKTAPVIKQPILDLAVELKKVIEVTKAGVGTIGEEAYIKNLPEDITVEQIKTINKYNTEFTAAAGLAFGEVAVGVLKKNKDLDRANLTIPTVDRDTINMTFDRSKTYNDRSDGAAAGATVEKFGVLRVGFDQYAARGSVGELGKVRKSLAEQARKSFGG